MRLSQEAKSSRFETAAGQNTAGPGNAPSKFYLIERPSSARNVAWDPWPVKNFRENALFKAAKGLINSRNKSSFDNSIDKIVLLPASGNVAGIQGGTRNMDLYSLRSPSILPRRIHLWRTPGGKIMVWTGVDSQTLVKYLKGLDAPSTWGSIRYLHFWKSLSTSEQNAKRLILPESMKNAIGFSEQFQDEMYRRWRAVTIFPFLDLPAEVQVAYYCYCIGKGCRLTASLAA